MNDFNFHDKIVLITGGSRGIGRQIAIDFARRGAKVAISYRSDQAAAEATLTMLEGQGHVMIQAEMSDPQSVKAMIDQVINTLGGLHILVNNAAAHSIHPIDAVDYADWQQQWANILGVNLIGAANASYCAAHHMMQHGGGRIVNVSSRGAFRGEPTAPAYGASKAGLNAMSQSLAKALAPYKIFVGVVAPGYVETEMARDTLDGPQGDFIRNESPLHRVATPEDVSYAVLFLASEGAAFMTGTIIDVNGASYLRT